MTAQEFYEIVKEYAKKEMFEEARKACETSDAREVAAYQGASHEAAKFYQMIESLWIDNAERTI